MKRIVVLTDMNFAGSGYYNIAVPLFSLLAREYQVIVIGLGYEGQEHDYPFSIIPCKDMNDATAIMHNLNMIGHIAPDAIVVAIDIPLQVFFREKFASYKKPYIAITPLENPPLVATWTAQMFSMDYVFFISELGKQAALKAGLSKVGHIEIGIDTKFWRTPTPEEKQGLRKGMGIEEDEKVILTVADNQERKNLWATLATSCMLKYNITREEIIQVCKNERKISDFELTGRKIRHILVTRVETDFGIKIRDMAVLMGINKELMTMNRGMPNSDLWALYALSDVFLLTSKAEGLGLPVMEAMSCGTPVVATDTGAIRELLENGRGFLVPSEYNFIDVWGNSLRKMFDIEQGARAIYTLFDNPEIEAPERAREYMETRTWDIPAEQLSKVIEDLTNVEKT